MGGKIKEWNYREGYKFIYILKVKTGAGGCWICCVYDKRRRFSIGCEES
ncbi:hypothetical protein DFH73_003449 [Clostridium beijerinckii]|nr:hypothetical protein [Clostridium beijerinckii]